MTYAALAAQGVSTALQAYGAMHQGQAASYAARVEAESRARAAEAQAESDSFNAKVYRQLAESETKRHQAQSIDFQRTQRGNMASLRTKQVSSGFAMEGSPMLINESIFQEVEFARDRMSYASRLAEARFNNQAELLDFSAQRHIDSAKFARVTGDASATNAWTSGIIGAISAGARGLTESYKTLSTSRLQPAVVPARATPTADPFYITRGSGWF